MEKLLIITGGSRGIGEGIIGAYAQNGYSVISIARTTNIQESFASVKQISFDLSKTDQLENLLVDTFNSISTENLKVITLINNAGILGEITTVENKQADDIEQTIRLNTTVPLILTSKFISLTKGLTCRKKIINISSGAAKNPYFGWVTYCASKAAVDMMTRAIALEQNSIANGAKIISIYPGVVDTEMQGQIRKSNKADFADIDKFINYKASGLLASIEHVGKEIFNIDADEQIENGALIRVGDQR